METGLLEGLNRGSDEHHTGHTPYVSTFFFLSSPTVSRDIGLVLVLDIVGN